MRKFEWVDSVTGLPVAAVNGEANSEASRVGELDEPRAARAAVWLKNTALGAAFSEVVIANYPNYAARRNPLTGQVIILRGRGDNIPDVEPAAGD